MQVDTDDMTKMNAGWENKIRLKIARIFVNTPLDGFSFKLLTCLKAQRAKIPDVDLLRACIRLKRGSMVEAIEMLKEELRLFPQNHNAALLLADLQANMKPLAINSSEDLREIYEIIAPFTMLSMERLQALMDGAKKICIENLEGNFVECGVAAGGSSALLAWVIKKYSLRPRLVYCFDTFEGMPEPDKEDSHAGIPANKTGWGAGTCAAPLESLQSVARLLDVLDLIRPIKGLFQDTLPVQKELIGPISFIHLDGDWYNSTKAILDNLYDQTVDNAYLQIDDYGYWQGCRKAIHEFMAHREVRFEMNQIDGTGVWFKKAINCS
jgi:O-methyltransferase